MTITMTCGLAGAVAGTLAAGALCAGAGGTLGRTRRGGVGGRSAAGAVLALVVAVGDVKLSAVVVDAVVVGAVVVGTRDVVDAGVAER
jgi:hypothetical protein